MADISKDEENYLRAVLLLLKGCRYIVLEVLRQAENDKIEQSGKDIGAVLKEAKTKLKKKTDRKQREKLFPDDGSTTQSVTWDISLITLVILKCYNSSLTQQEHEAVKTIRDERNKILAHSSDASLTRGDYDDVCRELENAINILVGKFDESVRQTCEERVQNSLNGKLQMAKDDVKTIQDDDNLCKVLRKKIEELEEKNRELRSQIERMMEEKKNRVFKTIQVVDTELEISAPGSDGHAVNMAEQILTAVIDEAIRRVGSDASVNEIRMAVDDILNEIEKCGMKVVSVEQRCIILRVECTSFYQSLQLLEFIEDDKFQSRLKKLADVLIGLKTGLQHPLELAFRISKKSADSLLACLRDEDTEAKRKISLPVQCYSVKGLASFWDFIEEGKGAERLSKALSKHLGKNISIKLSLNQEKVLQTLQDAGRDYATPVASASGTHTALWSLPEQSKSLDVNEILLLQNKLAKLEQEKRISAKELQFLNLKLRETTIARIKRQREPYLLGSSKTIPKITTNVREEKEKTKPLQKLKTTAELTEIQSRISSFKEIAEHSVMSGPVGSSSSEFMTKHTLVSPDAASSSYVSGTGKHKSVYPSENRARSITSVSQYDVGMYADEEDCWIAGCCMLPNDEILLVDIRNRNLKKLDASYRVTSTCELRDVIGTFGPTTLTTLTTLTYIGNSEVVVGAGYTLVYVNVSGNMSIRKTVKLHTYCEDVTCSNDRLYVLYPTSIHICTLDGDIISVLPLEESAGSSRRIAVADDGRMYVTTYRNGLICLDSSGNVINTLHDVKLHAVCTDDRGNVWSGGFFNKEVYQISADGSQILNTLSLNTVFYIRSMCYDKHRSSLIIGGDSNKITVIGLN